jgi:hypothetical protein
LKCIFRLGRLQLRMRRRILVRSPFKWWAHGSELRTCRPPVRRAIGREIPHRHVVIRATRSQQEKKRRHRPPSYRRGLQPGWIKEAVNLNWRFSVQCRDKRVQFPGDAHQRLMADQFSPQF